MFGRFFGSPGFSKRLWAEHEKQDGRAGDSHGLARFAWEDLAIIDDCLALPLGMSGRDATLQHVQPQIILNG